MNAGIRLIIGLGNPGPEYEATRHNAGFWLLDHLADDLGVGFRQEKSFASWVATAHVGGQRVVLAKPATFMNRSGRASQALMHFYKLEPSQVLVVHDELDLPPGHAKIKQGGGHAGHNGLRDIQAMLSTPNFWRLRIGIGHPRRVGLMQPVVNFVLQPPRDNELAGIVEALDRCRAIVPALVRGEFDQAQSVLHTANQDAV